MQTNKNIFVIIFEVCCILVVHIVPIGAIKVASPDQITTYLGQKQNTARKAGKIWKAKTKQILSIQNTQTLICNTTERFPWIRQRKDTQDDIVVFVWVRTQQRRDRQRRVIASTQENTSTTTTTRSCNNLLWHFHFRCEMFRNDNCLSANSYQIPMILWVVFLGGWEARWSDWDLMNNVLREFDLMWRQIAFLFSLLSPMSIESEIGWIIYCVCGEFHPMQVPFLLHGSQFVHLQWC